MLKNDTSRFDSVGSSEPENIIENKKIGETNRFESAQHSLFGSRYLKYRKELAEASAQRVTPDFPLYIMLEQSFKCNLKCPSCVQAYAEPMEAFSVSRFMSMQLFEKIISEAKMHHLCSISLMVNDEPLLIKNLEERIKILKDAKVMDIIMTTNGQLLTLKRARDLIEAGVTHINFSLDAATEGTYRSVRPSRSKGKFLREIIKVIDTIKVLRGDRPSPLLRASFVKTRLNAHEEDLFIEKFRDKVDFIDIQPFSPYRKFNNNLRIEEDTAPRAESCSMPFNRIAIRANGDVLPCCSFYGYELVMGNVNEKSISEIWKSPKMNDLRDQLKIKKLNSTCNSCLKE